MKKQLFLLFIGFVMTIFSACNSKPEPAIEGNWDCGDDCHWNCSITKQEGGLVMQTNEGMQYVFEKKSSDLYSAQMGMVTLVYHEDPPNPNPPCPGTHKGHWRLSVPGNRVITLYGKEEKC